MGIHIDRDGVWRIQGHDVTRSLQVKHSSSVQSTTGLTPGLYDDDYDIFVQKNLRLTRK